MGSVRVLSFYSVAGKGTLHSAEGIMERANNALSLFTFREGEIHLLRKVVMQDEYLCLIAKLFVLFLVARFL